MRRSCFALLRLFCVGAALRWCLLALALQWLLLACVARAALRRARGGRPCGFGAGADAAAVQCALALRCDDVFWLPWLRQLSQSLLYAKPPISIGVFQDRTLDETLAKIAPALTPRPLRHRRALLSRDATFFLLFPS